MSIQSGYAAAASQSGPQSFSWTNLNNGIGAPDTAYAEGIAPGDPGPAATTLYKLSAFGLSVPTGSVVKGIKATVRMEGVPQAEGSCQLTGVTFPGANVPKPFQVSPGLIDIVFGSITDLWSAAPTPAELSNAAFGIEFQATTVGGADSIARIDSCRMEVIFAAPGETVTGKTPTGGTSTVAYGTNEQVASSSQGGRLRYEASSIQPKTFAAGTGTLLPLTPVAYNTSTNFWVPITNGGANGTGTIKGFVGPEPITLAAGNEVLGNVIMGGKIHFGDIPATGTLAGGGTYTNAELKALLKGTVRSLGFTIQGLEKWY